MWLVRILWTALPVIANVLPGHAQSARVLPCVPHVSMIARGYGAPDDVAIDGQRVLFGDIRRGVVIEALGGRLRTVARGLSVPEGIIVRGQRLIVAEQGANRLSEIDRRSGRRKTVLRLTNTTGKDGIDGLAPAPGGGIYIPDSPNGRLLLLDAHRQIHVLASGLGRPAGAVRYRGGIAVADETAGAVWLVKAGIVQRLASVPVPDDVAVVGGALVAITLGDAALWEIAPHTSRLVSGLEEPQGLASLSNDAVIVANTRRNAIERISGLGGCLT